jgi:hypothetical protein
MNEGGLIGGGTIAGTDLGSRTGFQNPYYTPVAKDKRTIKKFKDTKYGGNIKYDKKEKKYFKSTRTEGKIYQGSDETLKELKIFLPTL